MQVDMVRAVRESVNYFLGRIPARGSRQERIEGKTIRRCARNNGGLRIICVRERRRELLRRNCRNGERDAVQVAVADGRALGWNLELNDAPNVERVVGDNGD